MQTVPAGLASVPPPQQYIVQTPVSKSHALLYFIGILLAIAAIVALYLYVYKAPSTTAAPVINNTTIAPPTSTGTTNLTTTPTVMMPSTMTGTVGPVGMMMTGPVGPTAMMTTTSSTPVSASLQTPLLISSIVDPNGYMVTVNPSNPTAGAMGTTVNLNAGPVGNLVNALSQWDPTGMTPGKEGPFQLVFNFPTMVTIAAFSYFSEGDGTHDPPTLSVYNSNNFTMSNLIQSNVVLPVGGGMQKVLINLTIPVTTNVLGIQWSAPSSGFQAILNGPFVFYSMPTTLP